MTTGSFFSRGVIFLTICAVWYFGILLIAVPLSLWYLYNFRAYELIALGFLIDAQFLSAIGIPYYTAGFLAAVFFMEVLKPRLRKSDIV